MCAGSGKLDEGQGPPGVEQVLAPGGTAVTMPARVSHSTGPIVIEEPAGHAVSSSGSDAVPPTK